MQQTAVTVAHRELCEHYNNHNNKNYAEPLTGGKMSRESAMCPLRTCVKHS